MKFPVDSFDTQWNTTAGYGFGVPTSYGFHEGVDLNDNNGGNSDLGKPLYAIADYEITSVHDHATGFGKHIHYLIKGDFGERYVHYAHCNEVFVTVGQKGKEGDKLATLGNSGNSTYAHLHWAIKKRATGIDSVAKTQADLEAYENPVDFVKANMGQPANTQAIIDELRAARDTNWQLYQGQIAETGLAKERIKELESEVSQLKIDREQLTKDVNSCETQVGHYLDQLTKLTDEDKSTSDQLLEAHKANQPLKDESLAVRKALNLMDETDSQTLLKAIELLKKSKVKQAPKPITLWEKIQFIFS